MLSLIRVARLKEKLKITKTLKTVGKTSFQDDLCRTKSAEKIKHYIKYSIHQGWQGETACYSWASIILVLCSFNEQTMLSTQSGTLSMPKHTRYASQTLHTVDGTSLLPPRVEKEVFEFNKEKPRQHLHCLKETRPRD